MKFATKTLLCFFVASCSVSAFVQNKFSTKNGLPQLNTGLNAVVTGPSGKPASSKEEDIALALKIIMDHDARSVTVTAEQSEIQNVEAAKLDELVESFDASIPYDAAAKLAYELSDKSMEYDGFKIKYEADAIALIKSKQQIDVSIPYDAAAKLAYETSDKSIKYAEFKIKYEKDAVALVRSKQPSKENKEGTKKEKKTVSVENGDITKKKFSRPTALVPQVSTVEWSTKKGASTFGLALDQAPPKKESPTAPFPKAVDAFPGALTNKELLQMIDTTLTKAGYDKDKTLVACSLCCDEVNRPLELDLADAYTSNFNMGGLAGFPFGGAVAFGAMAAHIPDGGSTLLVYGPHVGVDSTGAVGTVERRGRANGGSCCGSAVAASGYVGDVLAGKTEEAAIPDDPMHAQQYFVGKMLLPYAEKLEAADEKMVELPYALYEAQTDMVGRIVEKACGGVAGDGKIAVLGGIQINTPEAYPDYFLPRSFELYDNKGELVEDLMS